ncbi:MAG: homocysteine S-methyltransferase family protein [Deltaproteobacteria bacterium]|nr:homocysteine S-methyltransferase family protein [Deltaproteobacteria bacterium]
MNALGARLESGPPLLLDGGMGSLLLARGLAPGAAPEGWNLERGDDIVAIHRAYVTAGSEAIHTNTFGGNLIRLAQFDLADRCEVVNQAAVELARKAEPAFVLGDVGPSGQYLPPVGTANQEQWHQAFLAQGRALAAAGVDGFHVETMSDLREAEVALAALREAAPELPVLVSLTFDRKKRGFFTVMGNKLVDSLAALASQGASAVGANCSITSGDMVVLAEEALAGLASSGATAPLVMQPNAGKPRVTDSGVTYDQPAAEFAADVAAMARAGVHALGGCCGTDPESIAALRERLASE